MVFNNYPCSLLCCGVSPADALDCISQDHERDRLKFVFRWQPGVAAALSSKHDMQHILLGDDTEQGSQTHDNLSTVTSHLCTGSCAGLCANSQAVHCAAPSIPCLRPALSLLPTSISPCICQGPDQHWHQEGDCVWGRIPHSQLGRLL